MDEIKHKLAELQKRYSQVSQSINLENLSSEIKLLEEQTLKTDFWEDRQESVRPYVDPQAPGSEIRRRPLLARSG